MKSKMIEDQLSEISILIKRGITPKYVESDGICVLNQKCIRDSKVSFEPSRETSKDKKIPEEKLLQSYDVLVNSTGVGTLGRVAQIENVDRKITVDSHVTIVRGDQEKVDLKYFGYLLKSKQKIIEGLAEGSTGQTELSRVLLGQILVSYHKDKTTQKKIAHILSALDDKIELNRQMNRTLEVMAQALFKSWFVDFDPVRAKMEAKSEADLDIAARELGISRDILDLFPDKLVESEMGLVPEGWEVKALSELITIKGGGTPKRSVKEYWDGDILWFSVKDTPKDGDIFVINTQEKITAQGLQKSSAKILEVGSTIITARGTVGNLALTAAPMAMNQSCYAVKGKYFGDIYIYFLMQSIVNDLKRKTHGAVFDTITTKTFDIINIVEPSEKIVNCFDESIMPMMRQVKNNLYEIETLQRTRDILLPKLLSGELDVSEVDI